ncbi:unnamed protein product [Effrenium voratum]|nr:unnamed protein product [Effrenium voratum]
MGKGTGAGVCPADAEVVFFINTFAPEAQWLHQLLPAVAALLSQRLKGVTLAQDAVLLSSSPPVPRLELRFAAERSYRQAKAMAKHDPQAWRWQTSFVEQRVRFVARQPGSVKATIRLLKWWRNQQEWSAPIFQPSDEILAYRASNQSREPRVYPQAEAKLDGSGVEEVVSGLKRPSGLAVDGAKGLLWTDLEDRAVWRAQLDGSQAEVHVEGLQAPTGTSLALSEGRVIWADLSLRQILCSRGGAPEVLLDELKSPNAVATDAAGQVYWGDFGTRKIHRMTGQREVVECPTAGTPPASWWTQRGGSSSGRTSARGPSTDATWRWDGDAAADHRASKPQRFGSGAQGGPPLLAGAELGRHSPRHHRGDPRGGDVLRGLPDPWALALLEGEGQEAIVPIDKYSWTDEGAVVKVYVNESANPAAIAAAGDGRGSALQVDFQARGFVLTVGQSPAFQLRVRGLLQEVLPESCKVRLSAGKRITVSLAKKAAQSGALGLWGRGLGAEALGSAVQPKLVSLTEKGAREAIVHVLDLLSSFQELRVIWTNFYSQGEIWGPLLLQRPLVMDPANPCANLARPEVFQCCELMQHARSTHFFW